MGRPLNALDPLNRRLRRWRRYAARASSLPDAVSSTRERRITDSDGDDSDAMMPKMEWSSE
jgi:hypothetical protein